MKTKKLISILLISLILLNVFQVFVNATDIPMNSAYIENLGQCEMHLQYWKESDQIWSYIVTTMVGYRINGELHYAYCLEQDKKGVSQTQPNYNVSISNILENEAVWRAVINGFPYKSANELGVVDDKDAFVATKQAIYCVIYNWNVDSRYRGADERGWQIVNAIRNIVNTARTGTQTPNNSNLLNIEKIGEFKKDNNNFYSQEFGVTSSVEMSNYTITSIQNLPQGSSIVDINNNQKTQFTNGEHFKVLIPSKNILNNSDVKINIIGVVKAFPVFYGDCGDDIHQDYALTYNSFCNVQSEASFQINAYKSSLKIVKTDSEASLPLSNVEFNLKYEDGTNIGNFKTDENGIIAINRLKQGKIIVTEVKTQENYVLDENQYELFIGYDQSSQFELENTLIKGQIKIAKTSEDDNFINGEPAGTPIPNVEFEVYDSNKVLVDTLVTDKDGIAITKLLPKGIYTIKEIKSGKDYLLNDDEFLAEIVSNGDIIEVEITNKSDSPEIPVPDIPEPEIPVKLPKTGF